VERQFPRWGPYAGGSGRFRPKRSVVVAAAERDAYVPQVDKEHRWLAFLASHLPLPIPELVARSVPALGFPRPWAVYRWRSGEPATRERVRDEINFATDLADFLAGLDAIDTTGGPTLGAHSFLRGGPLAALDADTRQAIDTLARELDAEAVTAVWKAALSTVWERPPVWALGYITNSNLLALNRHLCAVLDFGCSAVGDSACDLAIAWTFFGDAARDAFRSVLALDEGTWARGRRWALWKALISRADVVRSDAQTADAAHRLGWPRSSRETLNTVLANV
jgi:aminoglycoside phosphotransferase (APT) family kinase protein